MTAPVEWPALLTIRQAAEYLNVSRATLAYWVYRVKCVPHVSLGPVGQKSGRQICRIKRSVLDDMIARGERPAFRIVRGAKS